MHVFLALAIAGVLTSATMNVATPNAHLSALAVKQSFHPTELNRVPNLLVWTDSTEINRREWQLPAHIKPSPKVTAKNSVKPRLIVRSAPQRRASRSRRVELPATSPQQIGFQMMLQTWPSREWPPLQKLWERESGWSPNNVNPSSGACGIPQALPCSKINDHSVRGQIAWGLGYIESRYGSPSAAWAHSQSHNWY